jgi:hypothetical protein
MKPIAPIAALLLAGCATPLPPPTSAHEAFFQNLTRLCGKKLEGRLVSSDPQDSEMRSQPLVAHFRDCSATEVRIGFKVGTDSSRNWVVSRTSAGLRLKHVHRHADGTEDALSGYGGDTVADGSAWRQEFPADAFSKALFMRRSLAASTANVWAMEARSDGVFAYELRRPGRFFRVDFDVPRRSISPF